MDINTSIAHELNVSAHQVIAAVELLDSGATVPFISRYRKEVTGGLSDTQLRQLEERLYYLRELEDRRRTILKSISEQDKLTPELEQKILKADNKATLEDIYLPYKPKRRTKAQIAKEAGLEPLATRLLENPALNIEETAAEYLNPEHHILTTKEALEGARHILMESFSESADLLGSFRHFLWENGVIKSEVIKGKEEVGSKFSDYFNYQERIKTIPSHRALAFFRGQREEVLTVNLTINSEETASCVQQIQDKFNIHNKNRSADSWLIETVNWTWRIKFFLKLELELIMRLRENADEEAINVFANNLRNLLMTAPAGSRVILGLDPGLRTGVKVVVVDGTGKLLTHTSIFPHAPRHDWDNSINILSKLCAHFKVDLVSIGNGTASRETDKLVLDLKKKNAQLNLTSIVVSEAGASVYSASELAANEFPDLDVSYRGAVSIARRLQDPLAELIKIDPKAIGVGQYQHDVNQTKLSRSLKSVMEDCVNAVGVDVNTASAPLLTCVAGLNESVANNIIQYRNQNGAFKSRTELKKIPRLGDKAFEQAAGFLRIVNAENPLDASAVHPEAYPIVEKILTRFKKPLKEIMGNTEVLRSIKASEYTDEKFGIPTITDIIKELEKPGRDPRPEFKTAKFQEGIESLTDLKPGIILEGVVTNVANFGAFVDIGVHQDGLVHTSMLADHFVKNPQDFIKIGQVVQVKVLEVDIPRKRIQLSMRLNDKPVPRATTASANPRVSNRTHQSSNTVNATLGNTLLAAFERGKVK
jgi:uncharacterized protein